MTSTDSDAGEALDEQLVADYFVQSPDGAIYPANAQGRSDLVARGYTDITDFGGAEKFREQNEAARQQAQPSTEQTGSSGQAATSQSAAGQAGASSEPSPAVAPSAEQAARTAPAASGRAQRTSSADQADDTAKA